MKQARLIFASFPEVTKVVSQVGRPDDGTDVAGFFNTEYFVDLEPREQWRSGIKTKDELISAMDERLREIIDGHPTGFPPRGTVELVLA